MIYIESSTAGPDEGFFSGLLEHDPDRNGRASEKWTPVFRIDHA
jgi:hypothetical protein